MGVSLFSCSDKVQFRMIYSSGSDIFAAGSSQYVFPVACDVSFSGLIV